MTSPTSRTPTLYLTRNGLLEPLGQSQVLAYLRGLSQDHTITLITFEKPEDWADGARMAQTKAECEAYGIRWLPQQFRARPKLIAPALGLFRMTWLTWRMARRGEVELIHARSYIPAAVGWTVWRLTGAPFIFDMRALWPEELITAGRLRRDSLLHRALVGLERLCLRDAAAVVSLTEAAVEYLQQQYPGELKGQKVVVIPTCADLARFTPPDERPATLIYDCIGTVLSGWFRLDWLRSFLGAAARRSFHTRFEIVTRDDPDTVRAALDANGDIGGRLSIYASPSDRIHEAIQRHSASVMFYAGGEVSELGRSPTRLAEVLGCGIPVIANDGVGDVAKIIRQYRVGVVAEDGSDSAMEDALEDFEALRADPEHSQRCRQAAEEVFSLEGGIDAYRALYVSVSNRDDKSKAASDHVVPSEDSR